MWDEELRGFGIGQAGFMEISENLFASALVAQGLEIADIA